MIDSPADARQSKPSTPALEIRSSGISGNGVYALEPVKPGVLVTVCGGTVLSTRDCPTTHHAMQIGEDLWLWSDGGSLDDNINHSCDPNVGFVTGRPELYSLRSIAAGEEICWDYSTSLIEEGWTLECRCGSPRCRSTIRTFFALSVEDRQRLLPVSLKFIRDMYTRSGM